MKDETLFSLKSQSRQIQASGEGEGAGAGAGSGSFKDFSFTPDQQRVFDLMCSSHNVFVTGQAGTGKSTLLKSYYAWYKTHNPFEDSAIFITSTTGVSSMLVGGMTIHRWSGIESGEKTVDYYVEKIKTNPTKRGALTRWKKTKVLIIDEISMMNGEMFDRLSLIGQRLRASPEPFGGIKVILFGDLLQLPPVKSDVFVFDAFCWERLRLRFGYLTTIVRQKDPEFQRVLNKIRVGDIDEEVESYLRVFLDKTPPSDSEIRPTRLFPLKKHVDHYNHREMSSLTGERHTYLSTFSFQGVDEYDEGEKERLKFNVNELCNADDRIELCEGAQVMYLVNAPDVGLVNGSRGIVLRMEPVGDKHYPLVQFLDGREHIITPHVWEYEDKSGSKVAKEQLPIILAWAISIHKCQGATLDYCEVNIGKDVFEYGQSYVALSRVKGPEGLFINSLETQKIKAHPRCIDFYQSVETNA